jgi:hypothetical protein
MRLPDIHSVSADVSGVLKARKVFSESLAITSLLHCTAEMNEDRG